MNVEFTREELQNLLNLLDAAVRSQGINAAQAALPLAIKIQQALSAPESV
tara:strand:+ start:913 stop:1062 length:150 start_codon:yes stop_codon:yes gene_type:complete